MADNSAPIPLLAYMNGRLAEISWQKERFLLELTKAPLDSGLNLLADVSEAIVLDGSGVLRNSPNLAPLRDRPDKTQLWVDSGVRKGEDIIDLVMADVGSPILPLRHLSSLDDLAEAAGYCERLMVALDWANGWVANELWQAQGLAGLAELAKKWQVADILIYHHLGKLPEPPIKGWEGLTVYIALVGGEKPNWLGWKAVRPMLDINSNIQNVP